MQEELSGIALCEAAVELMKSSHFDADVADALVTLIKYVDGVLQRPGDTRTRSIKLSNAAFKSKVIAMLIDDLLGHFCACMRRVVTRRRARVR